MPPRELSSDLRERELWRAVAEYERKATGGGKQVQATGDQKGPNADKRRM